MGPSGSGLEALFSYLMNPANAEVLMGEDARKRPKNQQMQIGPETFSYINEPVTFDEAALKKFSNLKDQTTMPLGALMTNNPLYQMTGNLSGVPVDRYRPTDPKDMLAGWYQPSTDTMSARPHPFMPLQETLRHEGQHAYQQRRDMPMTDFNKVENEANTKFPNDPKKAAAYQNELYHSALSEAILFAEMEARKQKRPTGSDIRDLMPPWVYYGNEFTKRHKVR